MNDTMSLILATAILAAGGLGLYIYKNSDEKQKGGEDYNEENLFGSGNFWDSNNEDENEEKIEEEIYEDFKQKPRGGKTKRRRASGGTKRRYY
jgi:hypothetical protein